MILQGKCTKIDNSPKSEDSQVNSNLVGVLRRRYDPSFGIGSGLQNPDYIGIYLWNFRCWAIIDFSAFALIEINSALWVYWEVLDNF